MRVTVCQWPNDTAAIARAWDALLEHVASEASELILLPEMPFWQWLAVSHTFDATAWSEAVRAHDSWEARLQELGGAALLATRPVDFGNERFDEAFIWEPDTGSRAAHAKSMLADEVESQEPTWYSAATPDFTPAQIGALHVGFLIGAELWATEEARRYGAEGVQILATPRATRRETRDKWLAAARDAAVLAAAYELSSNRVGGGAYGGEGWVIDPMGNVMALTSDESPFVTVDIRAEKKALHLPH